MLLVDDGDVNRRLFRTVLARAGVVPAEAANGLDGSDLALRAAADGEPFDLVLLDMQMPVMDGYAAAARLRERNLATRRRRADADHRPHRPRDERRTAACRRSRPCPSRA